MNPHACRIALRPRGPLEVFDLTLRLFQAHARRFTILAAALVIPPTVLFYAIGRFADTGLWILLVVPLIATPMQAPITMLGGRLLFSDAVQIRDILRELFGLIPAVLSAWSWHLAAMASGVFCGFAPLILTIPTTAYVVEAAVLERVGAARAFRRSTRLAGSNPGIALMAGIGWVFVTFWFALVGEYGGQALVGFVFQLGQPFGSVATGQLTPYVLFGAFAAQPVVAAYRLLLYVDARTRIEGWDLQVGLRAAGLEATR